MSPFSWSAQSLPLKWIAAISKNMHNSLLHPVKIFVYPEHARPCCSQDGADQPEDLVSGTMNSWTLLNVFSGHAELIWFLWIQMSKFTLTLNFWMRSSNVVKVRDIQQGEVFWFHFWTVEGHSDSLSIIIPHFPFISLTECLAPFKTSKSRLFIFC